MIERADGVAEIGFAGRRQRDRSFRPMKQPHAEQPLGFLNLPGERGRRDAELFRRTREMQMPGNAQKTAHVTQLDRHVCIHEFDNYSTILCQ